MRHSTCKFFGIEQGSEMQHPDFFWAASASCLKGYVSSGDRVTSFSMLITEGDRVCVYGFLAFSARLC